jgi:hypothetical protein
LPRKPDWSPNEGDRAGRHRRADRQSAPVPLAEQGDYRPDLDRGADADEGAEPRGAAVEHDQRRHHEDGGDEVEAGDRDRIQQRDRQQPDPYADISPGAARQQRHQRKPGQVHEQHRHHEGGLVGGPQQPADARQQQEEGGARRVLPRIFRRHGVVVREGVRPVLVELGVLVVDAGFVVPEADLDDHQGAGGDPDGEPDPEQAVAEQRARGHAGAAP